MIKQGIYYGGKQSRQFFDGNSFLSAEDVFVIDQGGHIGNLLPQNWNAGFQSKCFFKSNLSNHLSEISTPDPSLGLTYDFNYLPTIETRFLAPPTIPRRPYVEIVMIRMSFHIILQMMLKAKGMTSSVSF